MIKDLVKELELKESSNQNYENIINSYYVDCNKNLLVIGVKEAVNKYTEELIEISNNIAYAYMIDFDDIDMFLDEFNKIENFKFYDINIMNHEGLFEPYKMGFAKIDRNVKDQEMINNYYLYYLRIVNTMNTASFKKCFKEWIDIYPDTCDSSKNSGLVVDAILKNFVGLDYLLLSEDEELRNLYLELRNKRDSYAISLMKLFS